MNTTDTRYRSFALVRDMLETPEIIARFNPNQATDVAAEIASVGRLLLTGEGSSRIFPAKNAIAHARRHGWPLELHTEAGRQATEYNLKKWAIFALSNSGRTAEVIELYHSLREQGHFDLFSLTAFADSKLGSLAKRAFVLSCGPEGAVAATKSVIEQALFLRTLLEHVAKRPTLTSHLATLADQFREALATPIPAEVVAKLAQARTIFWAGRNNGVAEELTLKTNEITRKRSDFLEGTYAVHGIEEVMDPSDVVIWIDPYAGSMTKFEDVLVKGVKLTVIAVSSQPTPFPTVRIPDGGDLSGFVQMAAGWNLLVETGLVLGINLDKPERARKVGNEFVG
ncbi:MAG: sugar isomerase [Planctomycetes bacterium]|nr:sugar isomerase [Planctomycetota bacterium]